MIGWFRPILVALAVMVAMWALLIALAARLPPACSRTWPGSCQPA